MHSTASQRLLTHRPGCEEFIDDPVSALPSAKPCQGSRAAACPCQPASTRSPDPDPSSAPTWWRPLPRAVASPGPADRLPPVSSRKFSGRGPGCGSPQMQEDPEEERAPAPRPTRWGSAGHSAAGAEPRQTIQNRLLARCCGNARPLPGDMGAVVNRERVLLIQGARVRGAGGESARLWH